jgi:hypothetical protein
VTLVVSVHKQYKAKNTSKFLEIKLYDNMCLINSTLHMCVQTEKCCTLVSSTSHHKANTVCLPIKAALLELQELTKLLMLTGGNGRCVRCFCEPARGKTKTNHSTNKHKCLSVSLSLCLPLHKLTLSAQKVRYATTTPKLQLDSN